MDSQDEVSETLENLIRRTEALITEFERFCERAVTIFGAPVAATIRGASAFARGLAAEKAAMLRHAEMVSSKNEKSLGAVKAMIAAANIPHYEARWAVIKRRCNLVSMARMFRCHDKWTHPTKPCTKGMVAGQAREALRVHRIRNSIECDAVVEGGAEWIKVSTSPARRWIMEMAEAGICLEDEDDGDDYADDIPVIRVAKHLVLASRANPYKARCYPLVHIVLPRIEEGHDKGVDWILDRIRKLGKSCEVEVVVDCANSEFLSSQVPPLEEALDNLLVQPTRIEQPPPDDVLVLDANVLLSYISDITNSRCQAEPYHNKDIRHYIELENSGADNQLVPLLNVLLAGHPLVCTPDVFDNFRTIVETIGTKTERERYQLVSRGRLDGDDQWLADELGPAERIVSLQKLCIHKVPPNLQLPVRVVDGQWNQLGVENLVNQRKLPRCAVEVVKGMGTAKISSFLYGWHSRQTTVTGCYLFAQRFLSLIEFYSRDEDQSCDLRDVAPSIIKVPMLRCLRAKKPEAPVVTIRQSKRGEHWKGIKIV